MNDKLFHLFRLEKANHAYTLHDVTQNQSQTIYTERSLRREALAIKSYAEESSKKNQQLIFIAPFLPEIYDALAKNIQSQIFWLSITPCKSKDENVIYGDQAWLFFQRNVKSSDQFMIKAHPALKPFDAIDEIISEVRLAFRGIAARIKTVQHFECIWQYNFRRNKKKWLASNCLGIEKLQLPTVFILAGPSADQYNFSIKDVVWCADTALSPLLKKGVNVELVFSIDAGFGTAEHFFGLDIDFSKLKAVVDLMSFSILYRLPFAKRYSYASSHPLAQALQTPFQSFENLQGDVFGLMKAVYFKLFPNKELPPIFGKDGKSKKHISHMRGSGYHRRMQLQQTRLKSVEQYLFQINQNLDFAHQSQNH